MMRFPSITQSTAHPSGPYWHAGPLTAADIAQWTIVRPSPYAEAEYRRMRWQAYVESYDRQCELTGA
jgi:hypothetical protein